MTTNPLIKLGDNAAAGYDRQLAKVMADLNRRIMKIIKGAMVGGDALYDANLFLNSFPEMIAALDAAGYNALSQEYLKQYKKIAPTVARQFGGRGGVKPALATVSKELLLSMGKADLSQFAALGAQGIETLHFAIFKAMASKQDFSVIVEMVKKATVGVDGKRGSMGNYAYTHANTAFQQFSGQVIISSAEAVGHDGPNDKWEVTGPDDEVTREVCQEALADPIRTRAEWESVDYFGGAPGGWNCRHQLEPVFS